MRSVVLAAALAAPTAPPPRAPEPTPLPTSANLPPETAAEGPTEDPPTAVPNIPAPGSALPANGPAPVTEDTLAALGMKRQRDGTLVYVDPGKRFTATFNADGSVRFGDRWGRDQHGKRMRGSGWALMQVNPGGLGIAGPSEWLLALQDKMGGPEVHGAAKREFLARTAEVRTRMAIAWTLQILDFRLRGLEQELFSIWNARAPAAARRELLFQRWDECDEAFSVKPEGEITAEAASVVDQARVETAETARRVIEGFIRRQLPGASVDAFSPADLADMNRRRISQQPFDPYTRK